MPTRIISLFYHVTFSANGHAANQSFIWFSHVAARVILA